jgi:hypothetical protein
LSFATRSRAPDWKNLGRRHDDAPLLIALYETSLLKIRQQHLANPHRYARRVGECGGCRSSMLRRRCGERRLKPRQEPDGRTAQSLKPLLEVEVGRVEQQDAARRPDATGGAPDFLNVLLQRARSLIMDEGDV